MDIADPVPEVVCAQLTHITRTIFNLQSMRGSSLFTGIDILHSCAAQISSMSRKQTFPTSTVL